MIEQMKWENIYEFWKMGRYHFPLLLFSPVSVETVFVEYKQDGYIYGYDWIENVAADERKQLIKKNPIEFLYFSKPTNKGTIQTAEMLIEAQDEEELAAIWIAATAKELSECSAGNDVRRCAAMLYSETCDFLKTRYYLWHHAMRRLVLTLLIPSSVLESIRGENVETVIGLIQMNTMMLKSNWSILRYSSLKKGEFQDSHCRIDHA